MSPMTPESALCLALFLLVIAAFAFLGEVSHRVTLAEVNDNARMAARSSGVLPDSAPARAVGTVPMGFDDTVDLGAAARFWRPEELWEVLESTAPVPTH